jgi:iron(III) transport system substrate-binding protein
VRSAERSSRCAISWTGTAASLVLLWALAAPLTVAAADIALYGGGDRAQRLAAGAKAEGATLNLYTSLTVEDMAALNSAFEARHGIKIRMWRAASDKVLARVLAEAKAGRPEVDIVETNAPPLESLHREGVLQPVRSPEHAALIAAALPEHREWAGSRLNVFVQAYNTRLVRRAELPKSYAELRQPRWKGRLGIEASDEDWFAALVTALGEAKGLELFRGIVASNGVSVRRGHTLLANLVASGEVPLALTVYNFTAEQLKRKGAPLDWFVIPPAIARANGLALARAAPHPHAALLYYDFMLGVEAQRILAERGFVPARRELQAAALGGEALRVVDPGLVLDQAEKWTRLYESIFLAPRR